MAKRKRVVLNFQQKVEILQKLDEGQSGADLARHYGIGTSTISDIKRNGDAILQFVQNLEGHKHISEKKTRKTARNTDLDSRVYRWYLGEKRDGLWPPDSIICAKALEINQELANGNERFKASPGWLRHFKNRHGLGEGVKEQSAETPSVTKQLKSFIKRGGYILENVYYADDTVLDWRTLPNSRRNPKNQSLMTLLVCTNAKASHKLPLWVVGQEQTNEPVPDSVVYKHQENTQINSQIFNDWFENHFVPEVQQRQRSTGNVLGKILLVVENAPWTSNFDSLKEAKIDIFYLTDDCDLQMKSRLKLAYRKKQLELLTNSSCPSKQFVEEFSFKDSIPLIAEAWGCVCRNDMAQSWKQLMSDKTESNHHEEVAEIVALGEIVGLDADRVRQWLDCDKDDYNNYSVEDLEFSVSRLYSEGSQDEDETEETSSMEAHQCLQKVIQWFQKQEECNDDELSTLEQLRDLAAAKISSRIKQEKD